MKKQMDDNPTMIRIDRNLQRRLRIHALARGMTQLELFNQITKEWLDAQEISNLTGQHRTAIRTLVEV